MIHTLHTGKSHSGKSTAVVQNLPRPRALLLQGPVGPFFHRIAAELHERGFDVFKINFNGGDRFFYRQPGTFEYTGSVDHWPAYLKRLLVNKKISRIYLFGDCRVYHRVARTLADELGIRLFVFEEGYIRPNFITLEEGGVNGHSGLMNQSISYDLETSPLEEEASVPRSVFQRCVVYSMLYYWACAFYRRRFPNYQHHRPLGWLSEGLLWVRSGYRKMRYRSPEKRLLNDIHSQFEGQYFVCPLQVHCDTQVLVHSRFNSIEHFIGKVLKSFAEHAPQDRAIVFKHHPLDRGYTDYTRLIANMVSELALHGRVFYVHDLCLPTLLKGACGSVMINSTVGMSSLFHGTPVKVLGNAIYDRPELTFQGSLDAFWEDPGQVDSSAFERFRAYLIANNQINGNLYRRLHSSGQAGVLWSANLAKEHTAEADFSLSARTAGRLRLIGGLDLDGPADDKTSSGGGSRRAA